VEAAENGDNLGNATETYVSDEKAGGNNPKGEPSMTPKSTKYGKLWTTFAASRPVSVTQGVQALSVIIADMLSELDEPGHALGILVADAVIMWKSDADADD
jgi:hypothetical protein